MLVLALVGAALAMCALAWAAAARARASSRERFAEQQGAASAAAAAQGKGNVTRNDTGKGERLPEVEMRTVHSVDSDVQRIEVAETSEPRLGRCLLLDGAVQLCAGDEHRYHEMLVHFPARYLAGGGPRRALVLGGGDCMALRELVKYESLERAVVVEPDAALVSVAQSHLGAEALHGDARVTWLMGRGEPGLGLGALLQRAPQEPFDLVVVDTKERAAAVYDGDDDALYAALRGLLAPGGVLVRSGGEPHRGALAAHFPHTLVYSFRSETHGRDVGMVLCSADVDLRAHRIDRTSLARQRVTARFYNPARHFVHVPWFAALKQAQAQLAG